MCPRAWACERSRARTRTRTHAHAHAHAHTSAGACVPACLRACAGAGARACLSGRRGAWPRACLARRGAPGERSRGAGRRAPGDEALGSVEALGSAPAGDEALGSAPAAARRRRRTAPARQNAVCRGAGRGARGVSAAGGYHPTCRGEIACSAVCGLRQRHRLRSQRALGFGNAVCRGVARAPGRFPAPGATPYLPGRKRL